jgi:hypothetical protein
MLRCLLLIAILSLPEAGQAQYLQSTPQRSSSLSRTRVFSDLDLFNVPLDPPDIKGSPYYQTEYGKARFITTAGDFPDIEARFNIYYDRMEFKNNDSVYAVGPASIIKKVLMNGATYVVLNFMGRSKMQPGYFIRLDSGAVSLFLKPVIMLREGTEPRPMQPDGLPARYDRYPDVYFIRIGDGPLTKVSNIKKLIAELPDHHKEIEAFSRKESTSMKDPLEMTALLRYYNSLTN